jgi:hypothetical protein
VLKSGVPRSRLNHAFLRQSRVWVLQELCSIGDIGWAFKFFRRTRVSALRELEALVWHRASSPLRSENGIALRVSNSCPMNRTFLHLPQAVPKSTAT